jgi:hypothetical protein
VPIPTPTDPTLAPTGAAPEPTAFTEGAERARALLGTAPLDHASFRRPLSRCDLAECRGACCTDGAPLDAEEARVLGALAVREAPAFERMGLRPDRLVALTELGGVGHTGVRTRQDDEQPADRSLGLPATTCAAMLSDGRCAFQTLSVEQGRHPWFWKPMVCWLHPIVAEPAGIRLLSAGVSRDRAWREGTFASVTPCSLAGKHAAPAARTLAPELDVLGAMIGRDLRAELHEA